MPQMTLPEHDNICGVLQRRSNASFPGEGLSLYETRPAGREHSTAVGPRRTPPSLCPALIPDKDRQAMLQPTLDENLCRTTDRDSSDGLDRLINPTGYFTHPDDVLTD